MTGADLLRDEFLRDAGGDPWHALDLACYTLAALKPAISGGYLRAVNQSIFQPKPRKPVIDDPSIGEEPRP